MTPFSLFGASRRALAEAVSRAVAEAFGTPPAAVELERPANAAHGDYSTTVAFDLAKALRRPPREIAARLAETIVLPPGVAQARVEGAGYVNFRLDRPSFIARFLAEAPEDAAGTGAGDKVIVEHTNINPNKAAHIGHLRNAILGDTLVRCLRASGTPVEVQNYIDDTGVQVADVVVGFWDLRQWSLDRIRAAIADPASAGAHYRAFGDVCWDVYAEVGRWYESDVSTKGLRNETLHAMEEGGNARSAAAAMISEAVVREHVATMGRLGVAYDLLPRESDILAKHFWTRAFDLLKGRAAIALETEGKHAGCWVMRLTHSEEFAGLEEPDKILVRSNGTVTYTGKDIAYQLWKFGKLGLDFDYAPFAPDWNAGRGAGESIPADVRSHPVWRTETGASGEHPSFGGATRVVNVIDQRQSYPQKVVREGLLALGFEAEANRSIHFAYEMVAMTPKSVARLAEEFGDEYRLTDDDRGKAFVEMSGRKGLGVKANDLLELLVREARKRAVGNELEAPPSDGAWLSIPEAIAVGALRYFMLKFGRNKVIAFDFDEALNFEGDSGPYLQYSSVRVENILRKLRDRRLPADVDAAALGEEAWEDDLWEIFVETARIDEVVARAVETLEIAAVARHAYALAQAFSRFYHRHPIASEEDARVRNRRLAAALAFRAGLARLLSLLGIPSPEKM
ncbi:MAG TPA: arginine--tRNA ligase [Thermoanaerobaculia bacterium]|nr:arginine--tRNA ligase [Thermoanaerobaculia bacterium]